MSQFQNFVAGMSMSIPPKVDNLPIAAAVNVAKGNVLFTNDAGFMVIATVALSTGRKAFVAIEAIDNSGGANGDKRIEVVGHGQRVTVTTDTILQPGDGIKVGTTDGRVGLFVVAGIADAPVLRIGHFIGVEPGVYLKDTATPFAEGFIDDRAEADAEVGEVVIVELE